MSILDKASLIQIPSGYKSGKLYSIKPDNGDGDFTFSRSSSATRVNSEGLIETAQIVSETELVTNGDFGSDSDWNFVGDGSISNGELILPCCIFNNRVSQGVGMSSTKSYKLEINITQITSGDTIDYLQGGSWNTLGTQLGVNTAIISNPTDAALFLRNNNGAATIKIDNVSIKEVFQSDIPRLDYSDGSCPSLLLETQRTNLETKSNSFSTWTTLNNVTATSNYIVSPDGTSNATRLQFTSNGYVWNTGQDITSTLFTISCYAKRNNTGTENVGFFVNGSGVVDSAWSLTSDWVRFTYTYTSTNTSKIGIAAESGADVSVFGFQIEKLESYATSYIPTDGSTVTRTADVCNNAGTSATFNSTEGVLFAEIAALADDETTRILSLSEDGNMNNRVNIFYTSGSNRMKFIVRVNNIKEFDEIITLSNILDYNKIALRFAENNFAVYINGVKEAEQLSGSIYSANTLDKLNFDQGGGNYPFYGKTKQLMVFDEALSDEELSDLTGQINTSFVQLANFYNYTIL